MSWLGMDIQSSLVLFLPISCKPEFFSSLSHLTSGLSQASGSYLNCRLTQCESSPAGSEAGPWSTFYTCLSSGVCNTNTHSLHSPFWVWINPVVAGEETSPKPEWPDEKSLPWGKPEGRDLGVSASRRTSVGGVTVWRVIFIRLTEQGKETEVQSMNLTGAPTSYLNGTAWHRQGLRPLLENRGWLA